jgi:hypothetical protein
LTDGAWVLQYCAREGLVDGFFGNLLVWLMVLQIGRFHWEVWTTFIENSNVYSWFDYGVNACDEGCEYGVNSYDERCEYGVNSYDKGCEYGVNSYDEGCICGVNSYDEGGIYGFDAHGDFKPFFNGVNKWFKTFVP